MCGCNGGSNQSQDAGSKTVFTVETSGMVRDFTDETEAKVFASMHNGRIVIKKK